MFQDGPASRAARQLQRDANARPAYLVDELVQGLRILVFEEQDGEGVVDGEVGI